MCLLARKLFTAISSEITRGQFEYSAQQFKLISLRRTVESDRVELISSTNYKTLARLD